LNRFPTSSSATHQRQISHLENELDSVLPTEYKALLKESNGVSANLVQLYPIKEIQGMNQTYEVPEYAPGYLLIGSVNDFPVLLKTQEQSPVFENDWGGNDTGLYA